MKINCRVTQKKGSIGISYQSKKRKVLHEDSDSEDEIKGANSAEPPWRHSRLVTEPMLLLMWNIQVYFHFTHFICESPDLSLQDILSFKRCHLMPHSCQTLIGNK